MFSSPAAFAVTIEKHARTVAVGEGGSSGTAWQRQVEEADNDFANDEGLRANGARRGRKRLTPTWHLWPRRRRRCSPSCASFATHAASPSRQQSSAADSVVEGFPQTERPVGLTTGSSSSRNTRATQKWLHDLLAAEGLGRARSSAHDLRWYGARGSRNASKAAFQANPGDSPVRILLATDAASEGINLQNHCLAADSLRDSLETRTAWSNATDASNRPRSETLRSACLPLRRCGGLTRQSQGKPPATLEGDLEFSPSRGIEGRSDPGGSRQSRTSHREPG